MSRQARPWSNQRGPSNAFTRAPAQPAARSRAATREASPPSQRCQFQIHTHFPANIIVCMMPYPFAMSKRQMALDATANTYHLTRNT